jgi:hypothetical protein
VAGMSRYLHGGGVPFVADATVGEIADNPELREVTFSGRSAVPAGDGFREVTLLAKVRRTDKVDERGRAQFVATFGDKDTLEFLGRDGSPEVLADSADRSTRSDPKFYYRIVDTKKCGGKSTVPEETLRALAKAMKEDTTPQATSNIPAAYTYLGQFIAHDMTWMDANQDYGEEINLRTHALDLDSIFGAIPPEGRITGNPDCMDGICIGQTSAGRYEDLPRSTTGFPCIPDPRNDNNLAVAQLTVAMMKFHQRVCELTKGCSSEEQRMITRRHVQSVVLHDYLPKIIDPEIYCDVMHRGGRKVIFPSKECGKSLPDMFKVPVEFAAACFRFGHSMVRDTYILNDTFGESSARRVRWQSHLAAINKYRPQVNDEWVFDWEKFLLPSSTGSDSHLAASIDDQIGGHLHALEEQWLSKSAQTLLDGKEPDLATLTLLRGHSLELASAQSLYDNLSAILSKGSGGLSFLTKEQIYPNEDRSAVAGLRKCDLGHIGESTPLWYYVLREAMVLGDCGQHLGPMASRVVMETIHAAIEASSPEVFELYEDFELKQLFEGKKIRDFTLVDILQFAISLPPTAV